ncbi:MAG: alkaline phosphatase family protein [Actinobacteria bacterium]|nr:alkaline phosphatase family protein [Actinomycetota bacterium]
MTHGGTLPGDLVAPRYGEASIADLVPSAMAAVGIGEVNPLSLPPSDAVVVLVVDGLGARQLREHAEVAPFLAARPDTVVDAVFPTTTASSLASIGTGLPPGQHGITGYAIGHPDHDQPFNLLVWRVGCRGGGFDAREVIVPETYQATPTALERAGELGARVAVVVHPDFTDSGLTRAGLRGGTRVEAVGLVSTVEAAVAATRGRGPTIVYAHHGDVDTMGHVYGVGSDPWAEALATVDAELERIAELLPRGTQLLVTADHGMVTVPEDEVLELADHPELTAGVRILAGEPRVRQLWAEPGARDDVLAAWQDTLDGRAVVVAREDAIASGWFGVVADHVLDRIGEVVAVATRGSLVHRDVDPFGGRLLGQHGALTRDEVEVPLVRIGP